MSSGKSSSSLHRDESVAVVVGLPKKAEAGQRTLLKNKEKLSLSADDKAARKEARKERKRRHEDDDASSGDGDVAVVVHAPVAAALAKPKAPEAVVQKAAAIAAAEEPHPVAAWGATQQHADAAAEKQRADNAAGAFFHGRISEFKFPAELNENLPTGIQTARAFSAYVATVGLHEIPAGAALCGAIHQRVEEAVKAAEANIRRFKNPTGRPAARKKKRTEDGAVATTSGEVVAVVAAVDAAAAAAVVATTLEEAKTE